MKEKYIVPIVEIVKFDCEDVITTSVIEDPTEPTVPLENQETPVM